MKHLRLVYECTYIVFEAFVVGVFGIGLWIWDGAMKAYREWERS